MPAVSVTGLRVRRGDVTAVDDVTFAVAAGEIVALLGVNGAGKTTTVETLAGYLPADDGEVTVLGGPPGRDAELRARVGVALQDVGLHLGARPTELVELYAQLAGVESAPALGLVEELLGDRSDARSVRRLSGGEQRRLALVIALVGRPELLLVDEPMSGVDVHGRRAVRAVLRDRADDGAAVLVTTHELAEAAELADRLVVIDAGRVVADGTPDELGALAGPPDVVFAASSGVDVAALSAHLEVSVAETSPGRYRLAGPGDADLIARLTSWLAAAGEELRELTVGGTDLEEVFLRLTGGDDTDPSDRRGGDTA